MRLLSLCLVLGCADEEPVGRPLPIRAPLCSAVDPVLDPDVFALLTATSWGSCAGGSGTCIELAADGNYRWTQTSDAVERDDAGRWNFVARDVSHGVICLDDGSVIDFAINGGGLKWATVGVLPAATTLDATGTRAELDDLVPAQLFDTLTAHVWEKTNDLDLFDQPTSFVLARDGTYEARYRSGGCTAAGTFSFVREQTWFELQPIAAPNTCDTRGGGTTANLGASNERPELYGLLRLSRSTYWPSTTSTIQQAFSFSSYEEHSAGLVVSAFWYGVQPWNSHPWTFAFRNETLRPQMVTRLRMTLTPLEPTADGFAATDDAMTLVDRALGELVAPEAAIVLEQHVTFPAGGLHMLDVDVSSVDDGQTYNNRRGFVIDL